MLADKPDGQLKKAASELFSEEDDRQVEGEKQIVEEEKKQEDKEVAGTPKATTSKPEAPKVEEVVSSPTQTMKGLQRAEIVRHSGEIFRAAVESERWEHCHGQRPQGKGGSQRENVSPSL